MPNRCALNPTVADPPAIAGWKGWVRDVTSARFQPARAAGITSEQVPQLKLKWAFGLPGAHWAYGQPTVVAGRVLLGSDAGRIYSLDAGTACVYWSLYDQGPHAQRDQRGAREGAWVRSIR